MTLFHIQVIIGVSNSRPVIKFLKERNIYDFETKTLKIDSKNLKKEYHLWKKESMKKREEMMVLEEKKGRKRKNT